MTTRPPPSRVPTLTEVVAVPEAPATTPAAAALAAAPPMSAASARLPGEEELVQRVLADVQRQVELMLEVKLREALAPVLTRATDALMREARNELASTLRELVARAVAQELSRHRGL